MTKKKAEQCRETRTGRFGLEVGWLVLRAH
jgi:hypothetical protein